MGLLRILRDSQLNVAVGWHSRVQNTLRGEVHDPLVQSPPRIQSSLCYLIPRENFGGGKYLSNGLNLAFGGRKISAGRIAESYHPLTRFFLVRSPHYLHYVRCREINDLFIFDEIPDRAVWLLLRQGLHRKVIQQLVWNERDDLDRF